VQVVGGRELRGKLRQLPEDLGDALGAAVLSGANVIRNEAKRQAPYRTGTLKRSINSEIVESSPYRATAKIGTKLEYAAAIEFGSGLYGRKKAPIIIRPKNKRALFWKGAKHPVKRVVHPGVKPHPYLVPAFEAKKGAAVKEIGAALRAILRKRARSEL
jgi:HK97 gp10 family phage protein